MPSVNDPENFAGRVAFAASYISRKLPSTRRFDTCFEMHDGDFVCVALYRRVQKRPDTALARNIWLYLDPERSAATAAALAHVATRNLPAAARAARKKAREEFEAFMAEREAR